VGLYSFSFFLSIAKEFSIFIKKNWGRGQEGGGAFFRSSPYVHLREEFIRFTGKMRPLCSSGQECAEKKYFLKKVRQIFLERKLSKKNGSV